MIGHARSLRVFFSTNAYRENKFIWSETGTVLITWIHLDIGESLVQINGFLRPFVELILSRKPNSTFQTDFLRMLFVAICGYRLNGPIVSEKQVISLSDLTR